MFHFRIAKGAFRARDLWNTRLKEALGHSVPEIHHSDQGVQYL